MPQSIRRATTLLLAVALAGPLAAQSIVLRGATLIDGTDRAPRTDATVVVKNGWIVAVGDRSEVPVPRGARVVDLAGKWLLPGFIEMHGHLAIGAWELDTTGGKPRLNYAYDEVATRELTTSQLAFGITTVRNPAGPTPESVRLRNRIRLGEQVGPRLITSGAPIDGRSANGATDQATTPEEAREAVRRQAAAGVDFVKLYAGLDSSLIRAAVDEAHKLGLRAVAHLWQTSWTDAANTGLDAITHIIVSSPKLLPADKREEYRKIRSGFFMYEWFRLADFDGPEIREMIDTVVAKRISVDPTIVAFEETAWFDVPDHYPKEAGQYVPPTYAAKAAKIGALRGWPPEEYKAAKALISRMQELALRLHKAGVPLTAGTDIPNPWTYHRELEILSEAGIPNADVIRIATRNGARALGLGSEIGTIEVGKRADMVVLDADPIASIGNTRRIGWVMQGGRLARPADYLPARLKR